MFILDFQAKLESGGTHFAIHKTDSFSEDKLLYVPTARIVPSLNSAHLGMGRPEGYHRSKVLYLTEHGPIVHAHFLRSGTWINLTSGVIASVDTAYEMHTTKWRIEASIGDGRFETLVEFNAQPESP